MTLTMKKIFPNILLLSASLVIAQAEEGEENVEEIPKEEETEITDVVEEPTVTNNKISGLVFLDENFDHLNNSGDKGVEGVKVNLLRAGTFEEVESTKTDSKGQYSFERFSNGWKLVQFEIADGDRYVKSKLGEGNDKVDSDVWDVKNGYSGAFKFKDGETEVKNVDAGIQRGEAPVVVKKEEAEGTDEETDEGTGEDTSDEVEAVEETEGDTEVIEEVESLSVESKINFL